MLGCWWKYCNDHHICFIISSFWICLRVRPCTWRKNKTPSHPPHTHPTHPTHPNTKIKSGTLNHNQRRHRRDENTTGLLFWCVISYPITACVKLAICSLLFRPTFVNNYLTLKVMVWDHWAIMKRKKERLMLALHLRADIYKIIKYPSNNF